MKQVLCSKQKLFLPEQLRIGVVCGGTSSERSVSCCSGKGVRKALIESGFQVRMMDSAYPQIMNRRLRDVDIVFITLHGAGGEDGTIQCYLEKKKIPYVGSGPVGSRHAFDKILTKRILRKYRIPTPAAHRVTEKNWKRKIRSFEPPFFVKPPCEGSSIGVFEVQNIEIEKKRIQASLEQYKTIMIERSIVGPEYTVGILGDMALPVIETRPHADFYDYFSKYTAGMTDYLVPAPISTALSCELQRIALRVHRVLGLRDLSRIDFKYDVQNKKPYVLEANSIPGFTQFSLFPKAANAMGISFPELCSRLVKFAWERSIKLYHG